MNKEYWKKYDWYADSSAVVIMDKEELAEIRAKKRLVGKSQEQKDREKVLRYKCRAEMKLTKQPTSVHNLRNYKILDNYLSTGVLSATADNFGISRERVRQIVNEISGEPTSRRRPGKRNKGITARD